MTRFRLYLAGLVLLILPVLVASADPDRNPVPTVQRLSNEAPARVLFVGNSYLYYNDSLHNHVKRIADEIGPYGHVEYQYKSATISGSRLAHHDVDSLVEPGKLGVEEPFELVVLQGGSRETLTRKNRAEFRAEASKHAEKIRATGAEVALYMTHAYVEPHPQHDPGMLDKIRHTYVAVGNDLKVLVIPVGLAFERAYRERPEVMLHETFDGTHPNMLGTYLAACVVYQSIYGQSVAGIDYDYFGEVDRASAKFLQRIADNTVREFFRRDP